MVCCTFGDGAIRHVYHKVAAVLCSVDEQASNGRIALHTPVVLQSDVLEIDCPATCPQQGTIASFAVVAAGDVIVVFAIVVGLIQIGTAAVDDKLLGIIA